MKKMILFAGLALSACGPALAQYKCTGADGRVSFQQSPCSAAGRSERLQLRDTGNAARLDEPPASGVGPAARPLSREELWLKGMERDRRLREIDQEIVREREAMAGRAQLMEREMAGLRSKKASANNNLAGATWEQSISVEMQAVAQKYRALNDISAERIRALGDERKEVQKAR